MNGLGAGLAGPLTAYWFHLGYGVDTATIGATLAIGFVLAAFSSIFNGLLAKKMGMVKSVTGMRVIGCVMMLALPFMPSFPLASVLIIIRGALNRGSAGNRVALSASLTRDQRRGFATSVNALSMRLPSSIDSTLSGYLFDTGLLSLHCFWLPVCSWRILLYINGYSTYYDKEMTTYRQRLIYGPIFERLPIFFSAAFFLSSSKFFRPLSLKIVTLLCISEFFATAISQSNPAKF